MLWPAAFRRNSPADCGRVRRPAPFPRRGKTPTSALQRELPLRDPLRRAARAHRHLRRAHCKRRPVYARKRLHRRPPVEPPCRRQKCHVPPVIAALILDSHPLPCACARGPKTSSRSFLSAVKRAPGNRAASRWDGRTGSTNPVRLRPGPSARSKVPPLRLTLSGLAARSGWPVTMHQEENCGENKLE